MRRVMCYVLRVTCDQLLTWLSAEATGEAARLKEQIQRDRARAGTDR
jgi:hypothetical protein